MSAQLIIAASLSSFLFGLFGVDWESVDEKINDEYPAVALISADQLMLEMATENSAELVVIDVRELDEFQVSHLPGALHVQSGEAIAQEITDPTTPIVVYCSVGYRSAGVADELQALGYTNVRNLDHSIFEWANRDLPMVNAGGDTNLVHPFNRAWGGLVDEDLHAYSAEISNK